MLALVVAVALSQCTKDVECKGDRVCADGVCVEPRPRALAIDYSEVERRAHVEQLTRELTELRTDLASASYGGPVVSMVLGVVLGVVSFGLGLYGQEHADLGFSVASIGCAIGAAATFLAGGGVLNYHWKLRARLPVEISEHEARLRELGVVEP